MSARKSVEKWVLLALLIWTIMYMTTFETTKLLQRKRGIDTKTKVIERKSKNIMWVWERKLSQ